MDLQVILYLSILLFAFLLFACEIFPLEISALCTMVLLVFTGVLSGPQALSSFGNESLVLIASLFILIAGLRKTGVIMKIEEHLVAVSASNRTLSFLLLLIVVALVSAFVSNTATLAVTIPVAVAISRSFGESPKKWLMPVAFASVLGGLNSLIGTSTNIIISSLLPEYARYGLESFSLFTTAYIGLPILLVGVLYLLIATPLLLTDSSNDREERIDVKYDLRSYTAEVVVLDTSPLRDLSLENSPLFREADLTVLSVARADQPLFYPRAAFILREGDRLVVEGNINKLTEVNDKYGLQFVEETKIHDSSEFSRSRKENIGFDLHEVLISPRSFLTGRTPAEVYLRNRYRISLIAINRYGLTLHNELSKVRMNAGDILVVQFLGAVDNNLLDYLGLVPLKKLTQERYRTKSAPIAVGLFVGALLFGSLTSYSIAITCLAAALLLVIFNILSVEEVYESLEWRVLIFIGAVLCLGRAMSESGTITTAVA